MVYPVISKEIHVLLRNLLDSPDKLFHHVRRSVVCILQIFIDAKQCVTLSRSAAAIVTMLSYGHQIAPEGDVYVTIADTALSGLAKAGIYGTYLVDYFPFCESPSYGSRS